MGSSTRTWPPPLVTRTGSASGCRATSRGAPTIKTVVIRFGSTSRTVIVNTAGMTWSTLHWATIAFNAAAATTSTTTQLSISSADALNGHNSYGGLIDDVSVTA